MSIARFAGPENYPDDSPNVGESAQISIGQLTEQDLPWLRDVLESGIVDIHTGKTVHNEVEALLRKYERLLIEDNAQQVYVARDKHNHAIGTMSLADPGEIMRCFISTENPIEIVNACVRSDQERRGIGSQLVQQLEAAALARGYTEIVVNSGPRYEPKGWRFWTKTYGKPVGIAANYYGDGLDAPVWHKVLA